MSRCDLIADTLTILRNAIMAKKKTAEVPYSKINETIFQILKQEKYIDDFKLMEYPAYKKGSQYQHKRIKVYLRYVNNRPAITNLKRISKPGLRVYAKKDKLPRVLRDYGIAIISTSQGIITNKEAREKGIGGEVLCYIW